MYRQPIKRHATSKKLGRGTDSTTPREAQAHAQKHPTCQKGRASHSLHTEDRYGYPDRVKAHTEKGLASQPREDLNY